MNRTLDKIRDNQIARAFALSLLPLISILIYLISQGESLGNVNLAASPWNDELFYFKQVESILEYGYPQGYFGFNESHALRLSYAAWSPVLVWPWLLWGLLFGWGLMSPVLCNLFFYVACLFAFGMLARPNWKQIGCISVLFLLFVNNSRYILSGMPEILVWSQLILQYGLAICYERRRMENKGNVACMAVMLCNGVVMTWMRPYLILFLLLPMVFLLRDGIRIYKILLSVGILGITATVYYLINHYLAAEYLTPLFYTDWITTYFTEGFPAGVKFTLGTLYYKGYAFCEYMYSGITTGEAAGAIFVAFVLMMLLLVILGIRDIYCFCKSSGKSSVKSSGKGSEYVSGRDSLAVRIHLAICFIAMFFAILLMYKLTEGSKHLLTFLIAGVFVLPLRGIGTAEEQAETDIAADTIAENVVESEAETGAGKHKGRCRTACVAPVLVGISFIFLFIIRGTEPYDYQVPFGTEELSSRLSYWQQVFDENLVLEPENVPNYDNVIIWTLSDCHVNTFENEDGSVVVSEYLDWVATDWQMLYEVPTGFGISCCYQNYVTDSYYAGTLKCKYIMSLSGGILDYILGMDDSWVEFGRDDGLVAYKRRNGNSPETIR